MTPCINELQSLTVLGKTAIEYHLAGNTTEPQLAGLRSRYHPPRPLVQVRPQLTQFPLELCCSSPHTSRTCKEHLICKDNLLTRT
jgi:hypothetical protein